MQLCGNKDGGIVPSGILSYEGKAVGFEEGLWWLSPPTKSLWLLRSDQAREEQSHPCQMNTENKKIQDLQQDQTQPEMRSSKGAGGCRVWLCVSKGQEALTWLSGTACR